MLYYNAANYFRSALVALTVTIGVICLSMSLISTSASAKVSKVAGTTAKIVNTVRITPTNNERLRSAKATKSVQTSSLIVERPCEVLSKTIRDKRERKKCQFHLTEMY